MVSVIDSDEFDEHARDAMVLVDVNANGDVDLIFVRSKTVI